MDIPPIKWKTTAFDVNETEGTGSKCCDGIEVGVITITAQYFPDEPSITFEPIGEPMSVEETDESTVITRVYKITVPKAKPA
jgi:hypothetical protein